MMPDKISIYMNDASMLVAFSESTHIIVFEKKDHWSIVDKIRIPSPNSCSMTDIRDNIHSLIEQMGGCRVIAGLELVGLPFNIFDRMGFDIFTISSFSDEVLDGILNDIQHGNEMEQMRLEIIRNAKPVETLTSGIYFLDLAMLQNECPEISSKQALKDFLNETAFMELHMICKHIPPWLENGNYKITSSKNEDGNLFCIIAKNNERGSVKDD